MGNSRLLPYKTMVSATTGKPEAVKAVLRHYYRYIRRFSKTNEQVDLKAVGIVYAAAYGKLAEIR